MADSITIQNGSFAQAVIPYVETPDGTSNFNLEPLRQISQSDGLPSEGGSIPAGTPFMQSASYGFVYDPEDSAWYYDAINNNIDISTANLGADFTSADFINRFFKGIHVQYNITGFDNPGVDSVKLILEGKMGGAINEAQNVYYTLLESPSYTTTGLKIIKLYPGITASANASASDVLPRIWRLRADVTIANPGFDNIDGRISATLMR